jgi:HxlR-like helix-turn-helix
MLPFAFNSVPSANSIEKRSRSGVTSAFLIVAVVSPSPFDLHRVPVRVEYSLTPLGRTITHAIVALSEWSKHHGGDVQRARSEYWLRGTETDDVLPAHLTRSL